MIKAAPGIYLIEELSEKVKVNLGNPKEKKILKGTIVDVGANRDHDSGGKMIATFKAGDIVWFFSYVDGADVFEQDGKKYFCVLFHDTRAYIAS